MPIRERALENEKLFAVNESELESNIKKLKTFENIETVEYKRQSEFEKSILILPNADIVQTQNGKDHYFGNALRQELIDFQNISSNEKIRTLIAYSDIKTANIMVEAMKKLDFVDIVGIAKEGKDAYYKIVDLKPEMVFTKYEMEDMNVLEIVKCSKEKLEKDALIFNMIIDNNINDEDIDKIIGNKLNYLITEKIELISESVVYIMKEYIEYKNNLNK